jgi:hypothetical protein
LVVAVVESASCQVSASTKHAELCGVSRATLDDLAREAAGQPVDSDFFWSTAMRALNVAEKVC